MIYGGLRYELTNPEGTIPGLQAIWCVVCQSDRPASEYVRLIRSPTGQDHPICAACAAMGDEEVLQIAVPRVVELHGRTALLVKASATCRKAMLDLTREQKEDVVAGLLRWVDMGSPNLDRGIH
jgi:hypothetical protein